MKIGIDIRAIGMQRTGDETYTLQLVRNLAKLDKKNKYFLYTNTKDSLQLKKVKEKLNLQNKNFEIISVTPGPKMLWTFFVLPFYLKNNPVDILHVQYITPFLLPDSIRLITTIHDVSFARLPQFIAKVDLFFLKFLIPKSINKANKVIGVSKFTKKEILDVYDISKEKVEAVYNGGVSGEFFKKTSKKRIAELKRNYGIEGDYIFYVGTLQPRKNIPFLIRGFAKLKERFPENKKIQSLNLVIGGSKTGRNFDDEIDRVVRELDLKVAKKIHFTGYIADEELPSFFQGAVAFCFPSFYEGFGLPILEAMASKVPVVCSDSSCLPEIAKRAALCYKEEDMDDFIVKLSDVLFNKRIKDNLIKKGEKRVEFFSWDKCAKETLDVYNSVRG